MDKQASKKLHLCLLLSLVAVFIWSLLRPISPLTWALEAFPVIIAVLLLLLFYRKFRFTNLAYLLILIHAVILLIGAHYTYAQVPLFNWLKDALHLSRNHYDRLGHFAQGFIPALLIREVLLRKSPLQRGFWLGFTIICFCLALSALYELIEWVAAVIFGVGADAFLGLQGDTWDTQKDMAFALAGAIISLLTLSKFHNKALENIPNKVY
jgi:putative membrane protein